MTALVSADPQYRDLALGEFVTVGGRRLTGLRLRYRVLGDPRGRPGQRLNYSCSTRLPAVRTSSSGGDR